MVEPGTNNVLASVVVPTHNASKTLEACLRSVVSQTESRIEILVVDAYSSDGTESIARKYGRVITLDSGMTEARYQGALQARGCFVLNLDADQALAPTSIASALAQNTEMAILEERGRGKGIVALLSQSEKTSLQRWWNPSADPLSYPVLPRFYKRELLVKALQSIPPNIRGIRPCPYAEDTIIYLAARQSSSSVGFVRDAITHYEEESLWGYLRKWSRYGRAAQLYRGGKYEFLVKERSLKRLARASDPSTVVALLLRAIPFAMGYYLGPASPT